PSPKEVQTISLFGQNVPFGGYQTYRCLNMPDLTIGVEICEDLWVPHAPHETLAQAGATILCNLSASDQLVSKANYRRMLVRSAAARTFSGYIYCDAPSTESTQDVVFSAHNIISESGFLMAESKPFEGGYAHTQIDLERLVHERKCRNTFESRAEGVTTVDFAFDSITTTPLTRVISPFPFVPEDKDTLKERAEEILALQSHGLARRLDHTGVKCMLLGVSGGLDSTLALLVCVEACKLTGRPLSDIHAVTLPCYGTTDRTKNNALKLCEALGVPCREINIGPTVTQHLKDIGHDPDALDVTYENAQARTRTMVLMDLANQEGGLVVGTGDLSELALGWCTYNGDQMSMYGVNASVPKTLIKSLITHVAEESPKALKEVLLDIVDTPISPELLPSKEGQIAQKTEELVGKYDLNDFILFYMMRWGFAPAKIDYLMHHAYPALSGEQRKEALKRFYTRFFSQQFKRNPMPDGPKVGTVALSPRGDWRMPSDATVRIWLDEIESL
ncbi:MAG: NAD(+) synthase, partial [Clostridia bacterium]|nr:NAD(+) synthase [Clostridia bacterium]